MNVTRENYEVFFLDYYEGNLSAQQRGVLMDFLSVNPDLKAEFENFEQIILQPDDSAVIFGLKESLKKPANELELSPREARMIAHFEGDLEEEASRLLLAEVAQSSDLQKEFKLYAIARMEPDSTIAYQGKSALKHYPLAGYMPMMRRIAVAAILLGFMAGIWFLLPTSDKTQEYAISVPGVPVLIPDPPVDSEQISATPQTHRIPQQELQAPKRPETTLAEASVAPSFPSPMQLAAMQAMPAGALPATALQTSIAPRDEFAWFTWVGRMSETDEFSAYADAMEEPAAPQGSTNYISLASLAYSGLERTTGINFERVEKEIASTRLGFWDLAGAGIAGIGQLTGTSLTVDKERDEDGRITMFAIGDHFRIKR